MWRKLHVLVELVYWTSPGSVTPAQSAAAIRDNGQQLVPEHLLRQPGRDCFCDGVAADRGPP